MKIFATAILAVQSSLSFLFSGAEVAMNMADSNKLSPEARLFVEGGTRSLGTCALANHLANAGLSMLNGFLVGSYCGYAFGLLTTAFSLLGLWYLGELTPKVTAAKKPEDFLNKHATTLLFVKGALSPIVDRIVDEEELTEEQADEKELVSAAKEADEPWSLLLLTLYSDSRVSGRARTIGSINSIVSVLERHVQRGVLLDSQVMEFELICSKTLKSLGYFNTNTIIRWMMDHKPARPSEREVETVKA